MQNDIFISMDVNKIFSLFDSESGQELLASSSPKRIEDTALFHVGMFRKLILNENFYNKELYKEFPFMKNLDFLSEMVVFHRAFFYINKISLNEELSKEALKFFNGEELKTCFKLSIHFFEEIESYEKCAHLKKLLDFCEES
jgi:hypothetical protein